MRCLPGNGFTEAQEVSKPLLIGDDPKVKLETQNTLYTCLEYGLTLLHPIMPFVTEELYQRLPRRPDCTIPSIMVAPYPTPQTTWNDIEAACDFEFVNRVIHAARSMTTQYNIRENSTSIHGN